MIDGYTRMLVNDFDAYNSAALARIQASSPDPTMKKYTMAFPDNDPLYCWAIEENIFTSKMTAQEKSGKVSLTTALAQGIKLERDLIKGT